MTLILDDKQIKHLLDRLWDRIRFDRLAYGMHISCSMISTRAAQFTEEAR